MKMVKVCNTVHIAVGNFEDQAYKAGFEFHGKGSGINLRYQTSKKKDIFTKNLAMYFTCN